MIWSIWLLDSLAGFPVHSIQADTDSATETYRTTYRYVVPVRTTALLASTSSHVHSTATCLYSSSNGTFYYKKLISTVHVVGERYGGIAITAYTAIIVKLYHHYTQKFPRMFLYLIGAS